MLKILRPDANLCAFAVFYIQSYGIMWLLKLFVNGKRLSTWLFFPCAAHENILIKFLLNDCSAVHCSLLKAASKMGPESEMIVLIAFLALEFVAFFLSVIGNIIVIYVIARSKYAKKRSSIFILSVAVADLLVGLIGIPVAVVYVSAAIGVVWNY